MQPGYPSSSQVAHGAYMHFEDTDRLMSDFEEIGRRINQPWRWNASFGVEVVLNRLAKLGLGSSDRLISLATAALGTVMSGERFLSSDQSYQHSLGDTLGRLEEFRRDPNSGEFA